MGIGSLVPQGTVSDDVGILMLKKGLDLQAGLSAELLQTLPPAPLPDHLGQNVNLLA